MPRFTVDLSDEIDNRLIEIARKKGITKAEAMRKAFALLSIAEREGAQGNSLGIIKDDGGDLKALGRIVGV